MHGSISRWYAALLYLLAWLMLGLATSALLAAGGAGWGASLLFAVPLAIVYANRAYPIGQRHPAAIVGGVGATAACAALLWCAIGSAWASLLRALAPALAPGSAAIELDAARLATMFALGVILYGLAAAVNYLLIEAERVRQLQTRELETRLMAQDAELRMLRTQVDPHFLFNSLNSISALTSIDPAAARAMTLRLAAFFRHSLGLHADGKVLLARELELVRDFLAIEQVRFGERLRFESEVDAAAAACLVPTMLLQPLVENAVKHGIGQMIEPGLVRLRALRAGSLLRISVENDVDPDTPCIKGTGVGLDNVRRRLVTAYGHEASVHWSRDGATFRVELALPAEALAIEQEA
jgi:hypothetical protein